MVNDLFKGINDSDFLLFFRPDFCFSCLPIHLNSSVCPVCFFTDAQERGQLDVLKQDLGSYAVPVSLRWRWKEECLGTTLEKNWTEIVDSHSVRACRVQL